MVPRAIEKVSCTECVMLCVGRGYMGEKANVMTYRLCNLLKNPAADRGGEAILL